MREFLRNTGAEQKPSPFIRNVLMAYAIAFATDRIMREGLSPEGRRLVRKIVVRAWEGRANLSRSRGFKIK